MTVGTIAATPIQARARTIAVSRRRVLVMMVLFGGMFGSIGARLAAVMGQAGDVETVDRLQAAPALPLASSRGDLTDRNGLILATTLPSVSLTADPKLVIDPIEASLRLSKVLPGLDADRLIADLSSDRRFVWLRRGLTPAQQYAVNRLGIPGLAFQDEERRFYPAGSLTAHAIGFTDIDARGIAGLEKSLDTRLAAGEAVRLSIDLRLQQMARVELQAAIDTFGAEGGSALIMDVDTGEILAMVSLPDFDPADPARASPRALFNRNTLGVYEMGSSFKIFNTAMALESGTSTLSSTYDSRPIRVGRFLIRDAEQRPDGPMAVTEIFQHSSNIGSVHMLEAAGLDRQKEFLARLGLTRPSPLDLPEIGAPMLPRPWSRISGMTISYGYGMAVSPVQLVTAVAAVVNGGILRPPTLLRQDPGRPVPGRRVLAPEISQAMRPLMRSVVTGGSATRADVPGYFVGGKTATADKAALGGYNRRARLSSFVGVFPMQAPRYVVFAMLDNPQPVRGTFGFAFARWNAAPLGGRIIARMGPMVGIVPADPQDPAVVAALSL